MTVICPLCSKKMSKRERDEARNEGSRFLDNLAHTHCLDKLEVMQESESMISAPPAFPAS